VKRIAISSGVRKKGRKKRGRKKNPPSPPCQVSIYNVPSSVVSSARRRVAVDGLHYLNIAVDLLLSLYGRGRMSAMASLAVGCDDRDVPHEDWGMRVHLKLTRSIVNKASSSWSTECSRRGEEEADSMSRMVKFLLSKYAAGEIVIGLRGSGENE